MQKSEWKTEKMKTLNEVIKAFSEANKEVGCGDCQFNDAESDDIPCEMTDCFFNDALLYLKMYRSDKLQWEAERKLWTDKQEQVDEARQKYIDKLKELEIGTLNDPLTWDELKQMEGKPVWVELLKTSDWKGWDVVSGFTDDDDFGEFMVTVRDDYFKSEFGKTWNAYRKERE